jgi:hypothetical protein
MCSSPPGEPPSVSGRGGLSLVRGHRRMLLISGSGVRNPDGAPSQLPQALTAAPGAAWRTPIQVAGRFAFTTHGPDPRGRMPQCAKTPTQHRRGNCCIASTRGSRRSRRSWKRLKRRAFTPTHGVSFSRAGKQPACAENFTKLTDSSTDCTVDSRRRGRHVGGQRTLHDRSGLPPANTGESGHSNPLTAPGGTEGLPVGNE